MLIHTATGSGRVIAISFQDKVLAVLRAIDTNLYLTKKINGATLA
jgi:hypothetical protein